MYRHGAAETVFIIAVLVWVVFEAVVRSRWTVRITASNTTQTSTAMMNTVSAAPCRYTSGRVTLPVHQPGPGGAAGQSGPSTGAYFEIRLA